MKADIKNRFNEVPPMGQQTEERVTRPLLAWGHFANLEAWFKIKPPERKYIIEDWIAEDITAVMNAAGGVGKSNLLLLMCAIVAGGLNIAPFKALKARKVLLINVEDGADDIWRRIYALGVVYPVLIQYIEQIKKNLLIYAGRGRVKPFMALDNGRPIMTADGSWMVDSMLEIKPEFAVFDTKSRLYGLDENSNDHAAQWWQVFEETINQLDNGCTVLVSSHSSKAGAKTGNQSSNRGASAFVDNARLNIVLSDITDEEQEMYDIDALSHFSMCVPKTNYTAKSAKIFFEKTYQEGVPKHSPAAADRFNNAVEMLVRFIGEQDGSRVVKRDILTDTGGQEIRAAIKNDYGFEKKAIKLLVAGAVQDEKLRIKKEGRAIYLEAISFVD